LELVPIKQLKVAFGRRVVSVAQLVFEDWCSPVILGYLSFIFLGQQLLLTLKVLA
jgi:hypothetical protein